MCHNIDDLESVMLNESHKRPQSALFHPCDKSRMGQKAD